MTGRRIFAAAVIAAAALTLVGCASTSTPIANPFGDTHGPCFHVMLDGQVMVDAGSDYADGRSDFAEFYDARQTSQATNKAAPSACAPLARQLDAVDNAVNDPGISAAARPNKVADEVARWHVLVSQFVATQAA